jgi:hypothetical protein
MEKLFRKAVAGVFTAILFITLMPVQSFGQQAETLFSGNHVSHGGFGGPAVQIGNVAGETGVWVGGRGGWIINLDEHHGVSLGGGGYGLVTNHRSPINPDLYALGGYGGFIVEYINQSYRLAHFTATTLIGGGGLMLRDRDFDDVSDDTDSFFVLEPGVNLELNVTGFFRIGAGLNYRLTHGIGRFGFSDDDFSGFNGIITLKFGKFL